MFRTYYFGRDRLTTPLFYFIEGLYISGIYVSVSYTEGKERKEKNKRDKGDEDSRNIKLCLISGPTRSVVDDTISVILFFKIGMY